MLTQLHLKLTITCLYPLSNKGMRGTAAYTKHSLSDRWGRPWKGCQSIMEQHRNTHTHTTPPTKKTKKQTTHTQGQDGVEIKYIYIY